MLKVFKNVDDKERNNDFVNIINIGLNNLKDDNKRMSEDEKTEQPDRVVDIVEEIFALIGKTK